MQVDFAKVFSVIQKGLGAIGTLVEQGKSATPAIAAIENIVISAKGGKITPNQIATTEAALDALIDEFNEPLEN